MGVVWLDRKPSLCVPGIDTDFSEQHGADQVTLVEPWVLSFPVPWSPPPFLLPAVPEWLWASVSSSLKWECFPPQSLLKPPPPQGW